MCFGGKSKTVTPAQPVGVQTVATNGVADTSNDAQRKAAAVAATSATTPASMSSFGSELSGATPGGQ